MENEFDKKLAQTVDKPKASFKGKIKDLEKSEKGDGQKNDKLNKMMKQVESKISKHSEKVDKFANTLSSDSVEANTESKKQVKKMEELEMKLARVVEEINKKLFRKATVMPIKWIKPKRRAPTPKTGFRRKKLYLALKIIVTEF